MDAKWEWLLAKKFEMESKEWQAYMLAKAALETAECGR